MKQFVLLASLLACTTAFANDVDPFNFEKEHFSSSMTRDQAIAQSHAPAAAGTDSDGAGRTTSAPSTKTRAQVDAETREAMRFGLYGDNLSGTPAQEEQIRAAGLHASGHAAAE